MNNQRHAVHILPAKDGAEWEPHHASFSPKSCEEEFDKAVKNPKNKGVRLLSPTGQVLKETLCTAKGVAQKSEQLPLL
jgi:hypothetical protein